MSAWLVFNELTAAALVARWTALLALAWVGHRVVVGRNPRWRVILWRATLVGVAGVGLLTLAPPVLTVPFIPATRPMVVVPSAAMPSPPRLRAARGAGPDPTSRRQDSSLIAAMSDDGYAETTPEGLAKSDTLVLEAWGKVKGEARIGRRPAVKQIITFARRDVQPNQRGVYGFYSIQTRTDAQGRFVFDRVLPGAGEVSRVVVTDFGNGSQQHMGCWQEPVDVAPGKTVEVKIGGKGRAVVGRVALKAAPGVHVDWRQNRPATIENVRVFNPLPGLLNPDPRQSNGFAASLDKDGRFRVEDVPPGHYELTVTIDPPSASGRPGLVQELGRVKVPVDVSEGDGDAPVDLGEIAAEVKGR